MRDLWERWSAWRLGYRVNAVLYALASLLFVVFLVDALRGPANAPTQLQAARQAPPTTKAAPAATTTTTVASTTTVAPAAPPAPPPAAPAASGGAPSRQTPAPRYVPGGAAEAEPEVVRQPAAQSDDRPAPAPPQPAPPADTPDPSPSPSPGPVVTPPPIYDDPDEGIEIEIPDGP